MSTREALLSAIVSALTGVASGGIYRSRREQLSALPAVVVTPHSEESSEALLGASDHRLTVTLDVYAKGDTPDSAADPVLAAVWAALSAAPALNTGDAFIEQTHSIEWDFEEYDHVRASLRVTINYRTATGAM